ncbi:UBIQUITIN-CONJUGAT-2 domain-containing protein [Mycena venus]|uniref:UBIQUITIN-CONJUGAT-2 domain-containing protein n=1 Tax=Mycena venus TaxID=2733690 RepID=A0A8H6XA26_9AGAR|nr:UBIQUITIN-CONJUGAT-2 domain-containing protein [Mycena venus]
MTSRTDTHLSANTSPITGKRWTCKGQFEYKWGQHHHTYEREKAPHPLAYSKHVLEPESIDIDGGVHAMLEHSLDLGCGTDAWAINAAKEWPSCNFVHVIFSLHNHAPQLKQVGFDLVDIQIPLKTLPPEYTSIAERITWVHGNL